MLQHNYIQGQEEEDEEVAAPPAGVEIIGMGVYLYSP